MSDSPIRILHVGAGARGRTWLEVVASSPLATCVGLVEPDARAREQAARDFGAVASFAELEEALGKVDAEAALIASPSARHAEQATRALEAGLAVLIEKPFAPDVDSARRVIEAGRAAGRAVMVAEQFRYVPAERTVRRLIADGRLGTVSNATLSDRRRMPLAMHGPWVKELEYPQLSEIAVHHFDSLLAFFGKRPRRVDARAWNPRGSDYAAAACTEALIELEDDVHVQYLGTLTSNKFAYSLRVEGDGGDLWTNRKHVFLRPRGKKLYLPVKVAKVPKGDERPYPYEGTSSLLASLHAAVRHDVEPETSGRRNVWAIAMVHAGMRSDREGRRVDLAEIHTDSAPSTSGADS